MRKYLPYENFRNFVPTGKVFTEQVDKKLISH